jgi:hypothetical protein
MKEENFNVFLIIGIIIFVLIFGTINIYEYYNPSNESREKFRDEIRAKEIKNLVDRIFIDTKNHSAPYSVYNTDSIRLFGSYGHAFEVKDTTMTEIDDCDWVDLVSVGDSIIKPKGSLKMTVKKQNGRTIILDFEKSTERL